MPKLTDDTKLSLFYFDLPGKGEAIRLAAAVGGVAFDDVRLTREKFKELKENGTLP